MLICSVCSEKSHKGHDVIFLNKQQADGQVSSRGHDQRLAPDQVLPPPGEIHFLSVKSDSVTLSWGPPEGPEHPQTFRVAWRCDGQPEDFVKVRDIFQIEINKLKPGTKYHFYVATEGEDGRLSQKGTASTGNSAIVLLIQFRCFPQII